MLSEVQNARQVAGEGFRRWFTDRDMDLIVWYEDDGSFSGFQLCYDKERRERALSWRARGGFLHEKVDDGEGWIGPKMTPVLVPDGAFDKAAVAASFRQKAEGIDAGIVSFVDGKIGSYPAR